MIRCPKCGHENSDNSTNCAECHINLQFALSNLEQLQAQWHEDENRIAVTQAMERKMQNLVVVTTPIIQGQSVQEYLGIVSSCVVLGTGFLSELGANVADLFGTRASGFQDKLAHAREMALHELMDQAVMRGGDAVIGLDLDYMCIASNILMVSANGTVVRLSPQGSDGRKEA
jgi:uncharacterized protein YbjQ (UPF0145 family)